MWRMVRDGRKEIVSTINTKIVGIGDALVC